jgi:hypothetical protein
VMNSMEIEARYEIEVEDYIHKANTVLKSGMPIVC